MGIFILRCISLAAATAATMIGVYSDETWSKNKNRPTKIGWIVIALFAATCLLQVALHLFEYSKVYAQRKAYQDAYTGWVNLGTYSGSSQLWGSDIHQENNQQPRIYSKLEPSEMNKGTLIVAAGDVYGRKQDPPPVQQCPDEMDEGKKPWEQNDKVTIFTKGQIIKILETKVYPDCPAEGFDRVIVKATDARIR